MSEIDPYVELRRQKEAARERFASDSVGATMTLVKDEGVYRHLAFRFPKSSWEWCEILTWPGALILRGGLGCWSFTRTEDMFDLFRPSSPDEGVDPVYWAEKLVPGSGAEVMKYDAERAEAYVREAVEAAVKAYDHVSAEEAEEWLSSDWSGADFSTEADLMRSLGRFEALVDAHRPTSTFGRGDYQEFSFPVHEWDLRRYNDWFLLACEMLPWAVGQYDAAVLVPVG
ncbi:hypothetical protein [Streptomyces showdoensis]|uniref:hypothetical protein n=1 Tax=Streptomyces showdoensis TaxID=68268 RepID=UPI000F4F042B|nr:hypothetical protein [Streptomyces showdoensis]